jgi:capsular polysaccharide biosynthesis protein
MGEDGKSKEHGADQSGKHPQNEITASQGNQIMPMPPQGWYAHEEDEIDLADLAGVLYRRKWLIFGVTLVFACLALGASMMMTPKYQAMSLVEIGMLLSEDGYENVESSKAVKNRIFSLAKAVAGQMCKDLKEEEGNDKGLGCSVNKDLKIEAPEDGNIVSMELTAPRSSMALPLLSRINERLIQSHERIFSQRRSELENRISRKELAIKDIDVQLANMENKIAELKREYEEKTAIQKNKIEEIAGTIQNSEAEKDLLRKKISLLENEKQDLEIRIKEAEARYDRLMNSKLAANDQARGNEAVGLMLYSSEVQHMQNYLSQLRDRLLLNIPESMSELETDIHELNNRIKNLTADKKLEEQRLAQLEPELKEKIEELKGKIKSTEGKKDEIQIDIKELQGRLNNMIITHVLVPPEFSDDPVSPNSRLNIALGLVAGFFISVFMVFLVEFWQRNKEKIRHNE